MYWWINDFVGGGASNCVDRSLAIIWPNFPRKLHEMEEIGWRKGEGRP